MGKFEVSDSIINEAELLLFPGGELVIEHPFGGVNEGKLSLRQLLEQYIQFVKENQSEGADIEELSEPIIQILEEAVKKLKQIRK